MWNINKHKPNSDADSRLAATRRKKGWRENEEVKGVGTDSDKRLDFGRRAHSRAYRCFVKLDVCSLRNIVNQC